MRSEEQSLRGLISEYHDLTPAHVEHFSNNVSSAVFARHVASNKPFVIKGYGSERACSKWTPEMLQQKVTAPFPVALTPTGQADAVYEGRFVEPHIEEMTMKELFARLDDPASVPAYMQGQDDCLHLPAFSSLLSDVGAPPAFAVEFFDAEPDAANLWIGNEKSVTSVHSDPYENLYLCVRGTKTFTLFAPVEYACFRVKPFRRGRWQLSDGKWQVIAQEGVTPWSSVDVLKPDLHACTRFEWARPIKVLLEAGDLLYLPALWLHHVQQTGFTVAVNWWFDIISYSSPVWSLHRLVRALTDSLDGQPEDELDCDKEP